MEDKITLGRKAFKALSSDSRVAILKSLGSRRKMLSELSREFGMSPSTMKEHMDSLLLAGLVDKKDDGHKWKYYELTKTGRNVVSPGEARILIIIGISAVALFLTAYGYSGAGTYMAYQSAGDMATGLPASEAAKGTLQTIQPLLDSSISAVAYAAGFIVFALILGIGIGYAMGRRRMAYVWNEK